MRFGLRKYGDKNPEFRMPPFTILKQFGGVLPSPNGFGITNEDTVDSEELEKAKQKSSEKEENYDEIFDDFSRNTRKDEGYIKRPRNINPEIPPHLSQEIQKPLGGMVKSESVEYGIDEDEFLKWVEEEELRSKKMFEESINGKQGTEQ